MFMLNSILQFVAGVLWVQMFVDIYFIIVRKSRDRKD